MKEKEFLTWMTAPELFCFYQGEESGFDRHRYPYPEASFDYRYTDYTSCPVCRYGIAPTKFKETCTAVVKHPEKPWPDILRDPECGVWAVSERVVVAMEAEGITGYKLHPLKLTGVPKKHYPKTNYQLLEACGGLVKYNPILPGNQEKCYCTGCGRVDTTSLRKELGVKIFYPKTYVMDASSYYGADWAKTLYDGWITSSMCSHRVIDLACREGWTNAFFGIHPKLLSLDISIDYYATNWHDLLMYDIARRNAELNLVDIQQYGDITYADSAIEKIIKTMEANGESLMPTPRPAPIYDLHRPPVFKPASTHPFDDLSAFDGTAWQGNVDLPCVFGQGDLLVSEADNANPEIDDDLPTKGQRKLFDFFAANQERLQLLLLTELKRLFEEAALRERYDHDTLDLELVKHLQRKVDSKNHKEEVRKLSAEINKANENDTWMDAARHSAAVAAAASFADLKPLFERPFVDVNNANARGKGSVTLSYTVCGTNVNMLIEIACDPTKKELAIMNVAIEYI